MRTTLLQRWLVIDGARSGSAMQERMVIMPSEREDRFEEMISWQEGERRAVVVVMVTDIVEMDSWVQSEKKGISLR